MKLVRLPAAAVLIPVMAVLCSCAGETQKKPVAPTSNTSKIPWNAPVAGQGQGQLGLMPQNQYRR